MPINRSRRFLNRLSFRLPLFLSIALLPLGLIAVMQTYQVNTEVERRASATLGALTAQAVNQDREIIQQAFGAAKGLGGYIEMLRKDPEQCSALMQRFVAGSSYYSFAAYVPSSGLITCSTAGQEIDVMEHPQFKAAIKSKERTVVANLNPKFSGTSIIAISEPVFSQDRGVYLGYITISVPHDAIRAGLDTNGVHPDSETPIEIFTYNENGEVLTASNGLENVAARLPQNRSLANLGGNESITFIDTDGEGIKRIFAVVPIVAGKVNALGSWDYASTELSPMARAVPAAVFPVLMWITSLVVAYFAVNRLVVRHIRRLRLKLNSFAQSRSVFDQGLDASAPTEILLLDAAFKEMAKDIIRDEAQLEDMLFEKNVLLKEVHHRVKNNLQLIASIINMQMRKLSSPEARQALRRVQDRVLGLATIHRNLYQTDMLTAVPMDRLLGEVIKQLWNMGVAVESGLVLKSDIAPLVLFPDQAVPLSLLVTEGMTNALKYIGVPPGASAGWLAISLKVEGSEQQVVTLSIVNSTGAQVTEVNTENSSGLGQRLIAAFAQQLRGSIETEKKENSFHLNVRFTVSEFDPEDSTVDTAPEPVSNEAET